MKRQPFNRPRLTLLVCLLLASAPQTTGARANNPAYPLTLRGNEVSRLCRLMCGEPPAHREACEGSLRLRLERGRRSRDIFITPDGQAEPFRTSGGRSRPLRNVSYPIKVSNNGRYFVDQNNRPFLYKACTGWQLFSKLTKAEAEQYLENRRQKGFNTIQAQLLPWEADGENRDGDAPFLTLGDVSRPNKPYFRHVDWVIRKAAEKGIQLVINPLWIRQDSWRPHLTNANAEQYGRFLGERYKNFDNVVWFHGGDMNPLDKIDEIRQLAAGVEATDARHLQSYHAGRGADGSSTSSAQLFHNERWLDFNFGYCYGPHDVSRIDPYNYVQHVLDYRREPAKPFVLAESYYERERNHTGADRIRRQGYWTILSGGAGYAYGNFPVYAFDQNWQTALEDPGARHLAHLSELFAARDWHKLVPDFEHQVVVEGYGVFGAANYVTAARSSDGALVMAYVPPTGVGARTLTVDLSKLSRPATALWFNPTNGAYTRIGTFVNSGRRQFKTPGDNGDKQNDWVLIIESRPELSLSIRD